jgi:hypothetical protein
MRMVGNHAARPAHAGPSPAQGQVSSGCLVARKIIRAPKGKGMDHPRISYAEYQVAVQHATFVFAKEQTGRPTTTTKLITSNASAISSGMKLPLTSNACSCLFGHEAASHVQCDHEQSISYIVLRLSNTCSLLKQPQAVCHS